VDVRPALPLDQELCLGLRVWSLLFIKSSMWIKAVFLYCIDRCLIARASPLPSTLRQDTLYGFALFLLLSRSGSGGCLAFIVLKLQQILGVGGFVLRSLLVANGSTLATSSAAL